MPSLIARDVPVLVVGAGPAGLAAAMTLSLHGVPSLLVDRRDGSGQLPRATGSARARWSSSARGGWRTPSGAGGPEVSWHGWECTSLAAAAGGRAFSLWPADPRAVRDREPHHAGVRAPGPPRAGPPRRARRPRLVRRELGRRSSSPCTRRTVASRPCCAIAGRARQQLVRARYAVGADGAHSAVRRALGIALHGPIGWRSARPPSFAPRSGISSPSAATASTTPTAGVVLPAGGDRWLFGAMWQPDERPPGAATPESLLPRISAAIGDPTVTPVVDRVGEFHLRRAARRSLRGREHVPRGRRRAPRDTARRHGSEHGRSRTATTSAGASRGC